MKLSHLILPAVFILLTSCSKINDVVQEMTKTLISTNSEVAPQIITQFNHPGISIEASILDQVSSETNQYRIEAFNQVLDVIDNRISFPTSFPSIVYRSHESFTPSARQFIDAPILAYAHALKWAREGDVSDANKAIDILNGWANNFTEIRACNNDDPHTTGCGQGEVVPGESRRLLASWAAPNFAIVAEIMRHYEVNGVGSGWSQNDINNFEDFLSDLNDNYLDLIVASVINNPGNGWSSNNWGASAAFGQMAIGVFNENANYYNQGRHAIVKNNGLIDNIIDASTGEVSELASRDCYHPQMSLTALTYAADMERLQGTYDLYSAHSHKLRLGWKGMAKAFDPDLSFIRDCQPGGGESNTDIYPGVEKIFTFYYNHADLEILRDQQFPYGDVTRNFLGFTSYTSYCTHPNLPNCEVLFYDLEVNQINSSTIKLEWDTNISADVEIRYYHDENDDTWDRSLSGISAQNKEYEIELTDNNNQIETGTWYFRIAYQDNLSAPVKGVLY